MAWWQLIFFIFVAFSRYWWDLSNEPHFLQWDIFLSLFLSEKSSNFIKQLKCLAIQRKVLNILKIGTKIHVSFVLIMLAHCYKYITKLQIQFNSDYLFRCPSHPQMVQPVKCIEPKAERKLFYETEDPVPSVSSQICSKHIISMTGEYVNYFQQIPVKQDILK